MTDQDILNKAFKEINEDVTLLDFNSNDSHEMLLIFKRLFSPDFGKKFFGKVEAGRLLTRGAG